MRVQVPLVLLPHYILVGRPPGHKKRGTSPLTNPLDPRTIAPESTQNMARKQSTNLYEYYVETDDGPYEGVISADSYQNAKKKVEKDYKKKTIHYLDLQPA